ncbi:MAG TPA: hypothetical protein VJA23_02890 [Candidatus Nanoarchaeia archaeon]|nr:hypothetical protein [Candidatus Nanoarchaeia archaeon]
MNHPEPLPTILPDLLESLVQDTIGRPLGRDYGFRIFSERATILSGPALQQLQEQRRLIYGVQYSVMEGYRVPVLFESILSKSEPKRIIFYRVFLSDFGDHKGWDVRPEENLQEKLQRDRSGE